MGMWDQIREHRYRALKTFAMNLLFVGLGIVCAVPGPTLLDLKLAVNATMKQTALLIPIESFGHMFGSLISSFFPRLDHQIMILFSFFAMTMSFMVIPLCRHLISLYSILLINGLCSGALLNIGSVWIIHMWGKENVPFMQILYFAYGIGSLSGPLIVMPFLVPNEKILKESHSLITSNYSSSTVTTEKLQIHYGYGIGSIINLTFFLFFLIIFIYKPSNKPHPTRPISNSSSKCSISDDTLSTNDKSSQPPEISKCAKNMLLVFASLFVHVTYGLELSFGLLLPVYAVKSTMHLSKTTASYMASMYWTCFTFPQLLAAMTSSIISVRTLLALDLLSICLSSFVLLPFSDSEWALWVGTIFMGMGVSSIFPATIGYLEEIFPVTSKVTSLFVTSSCIAEVVLPLLVMAYIDEYPKIFIYIIVFYSVLCVIVFVFMRCIDTYFVPNLGKKKLNKTCRTTFRNRSIHAK